MRALPLTAACLLIPCALTGCGSGDDRAASSVEVADTINYGSFGTKADLDCGDGRSLNVGGSNNTLKVVGRCRAVSVGGADNRITLEQVDDQLSVVGLNNTVTYRAGEPRIEDSGSSNRITRG